MTIDVKALLCSRSSDAAGGWQKAAGAFTIALAAALLLAGCSGESGASDDSDGSTMSLEDELEAKLNEAWDSARQFAPELQDDDRPEVDVVRMIAPAEFGRVMVDCLHDSGYVDAELTDDGEGFSMFHPSGDGLAAYKLAEYACQAKYPIDPRYERPLTEGQLQVLYDYFAGPLSECLQAEGYPVSESSSFEEFSENYPNGSGWDPLNEVLSTLGSDEALALQTACPPTPAGLYD